MKAIGRLLLVAALLSVGLVGCASYPLEPFHSDSAWPPGRGTGGSVIGVRVYGDTLLNDVEEGTPLRDLRIWQEQTVRAYRESGLFAEVKAGSMDVDQETGALVDPEAGMENIDLRADVHIVDSQHASWTMAIITGATAYIIPSRVVRDITIKTTIRDNGGKILGEFTTSNSVILWQQLFLVVVMPFNYPSTVDKQAIFDLNRLTLIQASDEGALAPKPAAKAKTK